MVSRTWPWPSLASWYTMDAEVTVLPVPGGPARISSLTVDGVQSSSAYIELAYVMQMSTKIE